MTPRYTLTHPGAHPVKPGTSAALTARAIDATPPSTLAIAQQAVSDITSRANLTAPSPALVYTLGFTFVMTWIGAQKLQIRALPLVASAMMLIPLSSFHSAKQVDERQTAASYVADDNWAQRPRAVLGGDDASEVQPSESNDDDSSAESADTTGEENGVQSDDDRQMMPDMTMPMPMPMPPAPVAAPEVTPSVELIPLPEQMPALSPDVIRRLRRIEEQLRREAKRRTYRELKNFSF